MPIIPLTPGGILIPFKPSQIPGLRPGPLPRAGGYQSNLRNFNDIRQQMQQRRDQLFQSLQQPNYNRIPSPPVLSAASGNPTVPYASGNPTVPYASGNSTVPYTSGNPTVPYASGNSTVPYASRNFFSSDPRQSGSSLSSVTAGTYTRLPTSGLTYAQPSFAGSVGSASSAPYHPLGS